MNSIEQPASLFAHILKPLNYRKRKVYVQACESVTLMDLNWSGGTRSEYRAMTVDGRPLGNSLAYSALHPANNHAEGASVPLPQGAIMVRTGYFCGKDSTATIYVHPADMPKLLSVSA